MKAFQDHYPDNVSHCYGCGSNNHHGHQIKTYWEGDETVTRFKPEPFHTSVPGYAYGGLIASLIDCHSTGTAAAAMYRSEGRDMDTLPPVSLRHRFPARGLFEAHAARRPRWRFAAR